MISINIKQCVHTPIIATVIMAMCACCQKTRLDRSDFRCATLSVCKINTRLSMRVRCGVRFLDAPAVDPK